MTESNTSEEEVKPKPYRPGRPKVDKDAERAKVRSALWTPGLRPVVGTASEGLPEVWLPDPPKGKKKGTSVYAAWAMECFLELVRHGYNFTQATEKLGYTYKWWMTMSQRYPEWATEARAIAGGLVEAWECPDLSQMKFEEFLDQYSGLEIAEHQLWITEALQDPMARTVLILGHPESGKSTLVSLWYVLYRICQNPDVRIAVVSKSSPKAQDILTRIKRYLTEEHLYDDAKRNLIQDFGGFKPPHGDMEWSQDQIFIRQRKSGERDPTVQALGIGKQIYGTRLDFLILDDSLVLDNQVSETQRGRIDNWLDSEARSRAQRGQTIINGTRLFPLDLYGQWKKAWAGHRLFRAVIIPALQDEFTENERPTWPQYWTLDGYDVKETHNGQEIVVRHQQGLRDIRDSITAKDPSRWKLVYQQEDVEESENVFRREHVNIALDLGADRPMGRVYDHEALILGVDPATTGRAAAVLLAVDPITRVRTVVDIAVNSKLGATGIRNELFYRFWERYKEHPVNVTMVEINFAPTLMGDEAFMERAQLYNTVVRPHRTVGRGRVRGSKWDEEYGIAALASLFQGGLIAFANGGPGDRQKLEPLIDDMLVFPWSDQQDAIVALWVANGEADLARHTRIDQNQMMERRGVPPIVRKRGIVNANNEHSSRT